MKGEQLVSDLQNEDLVALSKAVGSPLKIAVDDRMIVEDPQSRVRLLANELIDKNGVLTDHGVRLLKQVKDGEHRLQIGIPFVDRKKRNQKVAIVSIRPWVKGNIGKTKIVTNGELLYAGHPIDGMEIDERKKVDGSQLVEALLKQKTEDVFPHTYQVEKLGGIELIWLSTATQDRMIAVQAKYFDFVFGRFPQVRYRMTKDGRAVQGCVPKKGFGDGIVSIIMAMMLDEGGVLRQPKERQDWRRDDKAVQEGAVPTGKEEGGAIRGE